MKEQDLEAWEKWNKSKTDTNLMAVMQRLDPVIQKEVNRWQGTLARPLLEIEAKKFAVEAIQSYNPNMGAALATHVTNSMKRLSRLSYTHQNLARMPEYKSRQYGTYELARTTLETRLGREPTSDELAQHLGWSKPYLEQYQKSLRKEFLESGVPPPIFDTNTGDGGMVDFVYNDLSPEQKKIFQHTTGYGGAKILTNPQLMKKLDMTQGQLSYQKRVVINKVSKATGGGIP